MNLELRFEGMTCLACARNIEDALRAVPSVDSAEVHYASKSGSVVASDEVDRAALLEAVAHTGSRAEIVGQPPAWTAPTPPQRRPRASEALRSSAWKTARRATTTTC